MLTLFPVRTSCEFLLQFRLKPNIRLLSLSFSSVDLVWKFYFVFHFTLLLCPMLGRNRRRKSSTKRFKQTPHRLNTRSVTIYDFSPRLPKKEGFEIWVAILKIYKGIGFGDHLARSISYGVISNMGHILWFLLKPISEMKFFLKLYIFTFILFLSCGVSKGGIHSVLLCPPDEICLQFHTKKLIISFFPWKLQSQKELLWFLTRMKNPINTGWTSAR